MHGRRRCYHTRFDATSISNVVIVVSYQESNAKSGFLSFVSNHRDVVEPGYAFLIVSFAITVSLQHVIS